MNRINDPKYRQACDMAAEMACRRDDREPFYDEDDMLEYYRELREEFYYENYWSP